MRVRMLLASLVVLALTACSGDGPTEPTFDDPDRPSMGGYMGSGD